MTGSPHDPPIATLSLVYPHGATRVAELDRATAHTVLGVLADLTGRSDWDGVGAVSVTLEDPHGYETAPIPKMLALPGQAHRHGVSVPVPAHPYRCRFHLRTPYTPPQPDVPEVVCVSREKLDRMWPAEPPRPMYEYRRIMIGTPGNGHALMTATPPAVGDLVRLTDRAYYRGTSDDDVISGTFHVVRRGFHLIDHSHIVCLADEGAHQHGGNELDIIVEACGPEHGTYPFFADEAPGSEGQTGERRRAAAARLAEIRYVVTP